MSMSAGIVSKRDLTPAKRPVAKKQEARPAKKTDTVGLGTFRSLTMDYSPGHPEAASATAQKSVITAHDVLKKKPQASGFQRVPMNTNSITASLTAANS